MASALAAFALALGCSAAEQPASQPAARSDAGAAGSVGSGLGGGGQGNSGTGTAGGGGSAGLAGGSGGYAGTALGGAAGNPSAGGMAGQGGSGAQAQDPKARDITFFVAGDTHLNKDPALRQSRLEATNLVAAAMNALPGAAYPASVGGGKVDSARGVIVAGDLTDTCHASEWADFDAAWAANGTGKVAFPVFEELGNHDNCDVAKTGLKARNAVRQGVTSIDPTSGAYSWDWGDAHFVNVGMYAGLDEFHIGVNDDGWACPGCTPDDSLKFLITDLAENVGASNRPVVIFQHFGPDDGAARNYWTPGEKERFYGVIRDYNIAAIFAAHSHHRDAYTWNNIRVFHTQSVTGTTALEPRGFLVVHMTQDTLTVAERMSDGLNWKFTEQLALSW
jgi:hypothetical protein